MNDTSMGAAARAFAITAALLAGGVAREARAAPTEVGKLALPGAPFDGIAVTPDGKKLYVSLVQTQQPGKNAIAVIDTATDTVTTVIDLGDQGANNSSARQLYMAPDGGLLIHATYVDNLLVIDTQTDAVVDSLPAVGSAVAVFTPDSTRLWSRDSNTKAVHVFDTADMNELASFPLLSPGSSDFPLVITPDGAKIYGVTSNDGGNGFAEPLAIDSFDVVAPAPLAHYGVGVGFMANALTDARVSPDGQFMYVSGSNATQVLKIEIAADTVVATADVPQYGEGLALSPDGATLYAFENAYNSGKLRVYAADSLTLQQTLDLTGHVARFLATSRKTPFAPSGCAVIVPAALKNSIFALDPQTHATIATFATPAGTPYTVEFLPNSTRAYVPWRDGATTGSLTILDLGEGCALAPDGEPCAQDDECDSNLCVDGVCCDSECGDGATDDCQACSVAGGGQVDGTCGPVVAGTICREVLFPLNCELAEACDGVQLECPPDEGAPDGEECLDGVCIDGECYLIEGDITGEPGSTGAGSTTIAETSTTGEAPTTGTPGSASDSGTGTGEATTSSPTSSATGEASSGDASSGAASDSDTGGQGTASDGCGCASTRTDAGWLVLLAGLAARRRRSREARIADGARTSG